MGSTLTISGMRCNSCVDRLKRAFKKVPGVIAASVSAIAAAGEA
ncbi:MAG: cation transporter [Phycisphaerales bacterium]|nr:cation transporter [Phycisphaerales bacterium]